jgi:glycosyltransferase involved in cell wall biosynthesis
MQRETVGEKHLEHRLKAVFSTYRYFDHLVSVSPELRDINRSGLAEFAPADRFFYALNTIEGATILEKAEEPFWGDATWGTPEEWEARRRPASASRAAGSDRPDEDDENDDDDRRDPETGEDPDQPAEELEASEGVEESEPVLQKRPPHEADRLLEEVTPPEGGGGGYVNGRPHRLRPIKNPGDVVFVCVGRLSPAKNHARLLDSFALVHAKHPHTRLWLIGGGALEDELRAQIARLQLQDAVHLTGQVVNPYKFMKKADCSVLSSDYEGQPVVILEARVLGLPVVSTAFASVGDSIPPGAGLVVPRTVEGLAEGMERFLSGDLHGEPLDYEEYNRHAVRQFEEAVHGHQI